jgi:hypothetical protein
VLLLSARNVHVLDTNLAAVSVLEGTNEFTELPVLLSAEETTHLRKINVEFLVQVSLRETVGPVVKEIVHTSLRELELYSKVGELSVVGFVKL